MASELERCRHRREQQTKLDALRRQAEVQFAAQNFKGALTSFDAAMQIAPDHPGVIAGRKAVMTALARWEEAEAHVGQAQALYGDGRSGGKAVAAAEKELMLALEACPTHPFALALQKMYSQHPEHPEHPIAKAAEAVALTDALQMRAAAQKGAQQILAELHLPDVVSYRQFLSWWQRAAKAATAKGYDGPAAGSAARDDELQTSMMIWSDIDHAGTGIGGDDLATVLQRLAEAQIVCLTREGQVLPGAAAATTATAGASPSRVRP